MKIIREQFIEALKKVAAALGSNAIMPEYQYFQVDGDHIQTFDGVILADLIFPGGDTGLKCAVPKEALSLLESLDTQEIDLMVKDGELQVRTSRLEGKFLVMIPPKFRSLNSLDEAKLIDSNLISGLIEGLSFCRFGVSNDASAGPHRGVRIDKTMLFSTDRYRVVKWDLDGDTEIVCTVPVKFIDLLKRHQSSISKLGFHGTTLIAILNDGTYISACLLQGEFKKVLQYFPTSVNPDLEKCFPEPLSQQLVEFDNKLSLIIDRHLVLLKDVSVLDREMIVEIKDGICTLTSKVPEKANLVEHVDVKVSGNPEINFWVNPTFLKEISNKCSSFKFFEGGLILFETEKMQYLMRAGK